LSTWNGNDDDVASLRWQQTANYGTRLTPFICFCVSFHISKGYVTPKPFESIGSVPNARQSNYFMAEAMDLGSPAPDHDIHPRNKQGNHTIHTCIQFTRAARRMSLTAGWMWLQMLVYD
jgi:hypothetical protein